MFDIAHDKLYIPVTSARNMRNATFNLLQTLLSSIENSGHGGHIIMRLIHQCISATIIQFLILSLSRSNAFNEHFSNASTFAEMYSLLEDLYVFFNQSCKKDTNSVARSDETGSKRSKTIKYHKDQIGVQK